MGISAKDFEIMQNRLRRPVRVAHPVSPVVVASGISRTQVILGIDPSLRGTGYGVIRMGRPHPVLVAQGTIKCASSWERSRCLALILKIVRETIEQHRPTVCSIEGLFHARNLKTALIMGEARGAALAAVAEAGLEIFEIAPRKLKQAMVGYGAAQKSAVARMVQRMLNVEETLEPDAADALALALVHGQDAGRPSLTPPRKV
jgi:crossover junction endodeoxyribonuclease RuvC